MQHSCTFGIRNFVAASKRKKKGRNKCKTGDLLKLCLSAASFGGAVFRGRSTLCIMFRLCFVVVVCSLFVVGVSGAVICLFPERSSAPLDSSFQEWSLCPCDSFAICSTFSCLVANVSLAFNSQGGGIVSVLISPGTHGNAHDVRFGEGVDRSVVGGILTIGSLIPGQRASIYSSFYFSFLSNQLVQIQVDSLEFLPCCSNLVFTIQGVEIAISNCSFDQAGAISVYSSLSSSSTSRVILDSLSFISFHPSSVRWLSVLYFEGVEFLNISNVDSVCINCVSGFTVAKSKNNSHIKQIQWFKLAIWRVIGVLI